MKDLLRHVTHHDTSCVFRRTEENQMSSENECRCGGSCGLANDDVDRIAPPERAGFVADSARIGTAVEGLS
jgi:hypothetical protein